MPQARESRCLSSEGFRAPRTSFLSCSITQSRPERSPSSTRFSNTQTLTSLFVVLWVAPTTFHRPTANDFGPAGDERPDERLVDDAEGDGPALCMLYAESVDDLPKRLDATDSMVLAV